MADITGNNSYLNSGLDFYIPEIHEDGYWVLLDNQSTPILKKFANATTYVDVRTIEGVRTSWYQDTLYTVNDLYGFAQVSASDNFSGRTIQLGADITINTGDAKNATVRANWRKWTPIGVWDGNPSAQKFAGTFDGKQHTISGLYVSETGKFLGLFGRIDNATIQNLKLVNSYIENTSAGANADKYVGSIAGLFGGTISDVQSDAIVVNNCKITGGLVGSAQTQTTIVDSEFKGSLYGADGMGGLIGWINATTVTINHCLNSGDIHVQAMRTTAYEVGGLVGTAMTATLTITDSLNAGTIQLASGVPISYVGNLVGRVNWKSTATLTNVYGKKQSKEDVDVREIYKTNVTRNNCELLDDISEKLEAFYK